jgi:ADP-heptose:LPS heptosyltransferase
MIAEPRRILIVALGNLGDLVFSSALAAPLHAAYPNARIDVWCKAYASAVAPLIPHVSEVIAADPFWAIQPHIGRQPMMRFLSSMQRVRQARYDIAMISEAPWRTAALR